MKAILRQIRISPKKANLVADLVRKMNAKKAMDLLRFTPKKAAPVLRKLIQSALANAETNFKQDPEAMIVKEIIVTEGPTYKRRVSISKGRVHPILKRTSHITVKLEGVTKEVETAKAEVEEVKTEIKEEVKSEKPKVKTQAKPKAKAKVKSNS